MRTARVLGLLVVVGLLAVSSNGSAMVWGSSEMILTTDRALYAVGDTVVLTVYLFDQGAAVDPLGLLVSLNPDRNVSRVVTAVSEATGVFRSSFTLLDTDVVTPFAFSSYRYTDVRVTATLPAPFPGNRTIVYTTTLQVAPAHEVQIQLSPVAANVHPGDVVDATITVRYDGALRDAEDLNVTLSASSLVSGSVTEYPAATHTDTGTYALAVEVPSELVGPAEALMLVRATVNATEASAIAYYFVDGTLPFQLWVHAVDLEPTYALVDFWVSATQGSGVAAANVSLEYGGLICLDHGCHSASAITDAQGRARFNFTVLPGLFGGYPIYYQGNVTEGDQRMAVSGLIFAEPSNPPHTGLSLVPEDPLLVPEVGAPVVANYSVRYDADPLPNQQVFYWVYTSRALVANGSASTDGEGRLRLQFTMPGALTEIEVAANITGMWFSAMTTVTPGHRLDVQVGDFHVGRPVPVNVTLPSEPGPWLLVSLALPYNGTSTNLLGGEWQPSTLFGLPTLRVVEGGSVVRMNVTLPRFLPKDQDYLLVLESASLAGGTLLTDAGRIYLFAQEYHVANEPPIASATVAPSSLLTGETVAVDASASSDPDGYAVAYAVDWGDGSSLGWDEDPAAIHTYAAAGTYTITIRVRDDTGAVASAAYPVVVDTAILGIRSGVFWPLVTVILVAAVVIVLVAVRRRRKGRSTMAPPAEPAVPAPPPGVPPNPPPPP